MIERDCATTIDGYLQFPVIALLGPRQSGKTTLARKHFPGHRYTSLEDLDMRDLALTDPRKFLRIHDNEHGIIIDEFQYVPNLLSYIQLEVDEKKRPGYFILTGSQNFLMNQAITQSLAGRVALFTLLPLSLHEMSRSNIMPATIDQAIFTGSYPRIFSDNIAPEKLYPSYIQTYVERDVRQLINVGDLNIFQRFVKLCAGRIGQLLNLAEISGVCGISLPTAQRWLSVLETSYIVFLLQPYFNNYNKRLTKSPKLYFYDTGLACSLLGLESAQSVGVGSFVGSLFENFIIADLYKQYYNSGRRPSVYFWRDLNGRIEVDCIIENNGSLIPIEIKSGETVAASFFKQLEQWSTIAKVAADDRYVIYGGDLVQQRPGGNIVGWRSAGTIIQQLKSS